ncbi:MAG: alpha/beta hydrolase-fold protein, partial [Chloroflexota bacterium]|nr:alpha/beta hydrolase-fold protein [Chloroflexota bacterium]
FPNIAHALSKETNLAKAYVFGESKQTSQGKPLTAYNRSFPANPPQESRIETFTIPMPQLGDRQKDIQVYLPPDYDSSDTAYPVFYLHNGDDLFNPRPEAVGDYKVDETLDELFFEGSLGGVIVVGIEVDRDSPWDEYMPWVNENMHDWVNTNNSDPVQGGDGFAFINFIVHTLKPEIDSRYRTLPDRENTAIGGFCRGAIFPLLAGISFPEVFSKVMSVSPAVWMAEEGGRWLSNNHLINFINSAPIPQNVTFYLEIGTEESSGRRPPIKDQDGKRITYPQAYIEGAEIIYQSLLNSGLPKSNIIFRTIEGSKGGRDEWAKRIDDIVLWFFGDMEIPTSTPMLTPSLTISPLPESSTETVEPAETESNTSPIAIVIVSCVLLGLLYLLLIIFLKKRKP